MEYNLRDKTKLKLTKKDKVAVLTGAGISAESGIKTFRDANGLWENHPVEDVATPEGFIRDPEMVWKFYRQRLQQILTVKPNSGHYALKRLENFLGDNFLLITQNIDGLHGLAGSERVLEMHGTIHRSFCSDCGISVPTTKTDSKESVPKCLKCKGSVRPDVVWFGEIPYHLDEIMAFLRDTKYFLTVGTSGVVYPAAQFLLIAKHAGAFTIGINLDPPENLNFLDEFHQGLSGMILPELVNIWLPEKSR
jgi:NAD-dependent deacetylase